jgi:hypothetical protein
VERVYGGESVTIVPRVVTPLPLRAQPSESSSKEEAVVSAPFIYIGTYRLKEGTLEAFKQMCGGLAEFVESREPRVIAFNVYSSEDGTEASVVQVHPDADSMLFHMQLLSEHITSAYEEQSPIDVATSNQIYGTPSEAVLEMIEQFDPGVPLIVKPQPLGGFVRSAAEQVASAR